MSDFLERHGTVFMLFTLYVGMFAATIWLGLRAHVDGEKLFAFSAGFAGGAWSGLTLAMRVSSGPTPTPPPIVQAPVAPLPDNGQLKGLGYKVST